MERIFTARHLLTGDAPPMEGGAFLCVSGRISAIGTLETLKKQHPGVAVTEFSDALIVPLLVNAHTHLELTDFPDWAAQQNLNDSPRTFIDWILRLIRVKRNLDQSCYAGSLKNGLEQSVHAGTGVVGDILAHHNARSAYVGTPLCGTLYLETLGQDPAMIRRLKKGLRQVLDTPFDGPVSLGVSPHSPYTISRRYLRYVFELSRKRGLRCATHIAESADEEKFTFDSRGALAELFYPAVNWQEYLPLPMGCRPVEYLHQQGGLFPENLLVHGVHLNAADIALLADKGMFLALCPRSNAKLNVGKAPVAELLKAGVRLALGTDSMASNDSLSVWDEMAFAAQWFGGDLDAPTLFRMATQNGADALGAGESLGSLAIGRKSSFQVVDMPSAIPPGEIYDNLVAGVSACRIRQVYHDGIACRSGLGCDVNAGNA